MAKIDKKSEALKKLQAKLEVMKSKMKREEWNIAQINKKKRLNKIIEAGKLFEQVGILYDYDESEILKILEDYRRRNES